MQLRSTPDDWGSIAKAFHWITAIFIIIMLVIGIAMTRLLESELSLKFVVYQLHKSFGFVILIFSAMRLLWRLFAQETPRAPSELPQYQRWLGQAVHLLLYSLLFAMPITGLIAASASPLNVPTVIFGLFTLPRIVGPSAEISAIFQTAHAWLAWTLVATLVLHFVGAVWHHFVLSDDTLRRMMPRRAGRPA
jgi:cytochrome b561